MWTDLVPESLRPHYVVTAAAHRASLKWFKDRPDVDERVRELSPDEQAIHFLRFGGEVVTHVWEVRLPPKPVKNGWIGEHVCDIEYF